MTEVEKKDKLLVKIPTAIAQFEQSARKELIVRGLMEVADVHDADFYFFKGEDFRLRGKYRDAIANYNKAIYIDPEHEHSLFWMGYCYYSHYIEEEVVDDLKIDKTTRYERVISAYQKLVAVREKKDEIVWDDYPIYYNLGLAQYNLDLCEEAIESFKRSIELNPDHKRSYYMLGRAQYHLELYKEASENFMHARELNTYENKENTERQERIKKLERRIKKLEKMIAELESMKAS